MEQTKQIKTAKVFLAAVLTFIVTLAMVFAILPATTLTAYAAGGTEVTQANVICQQYSYMDAGSYSGGSMYDTPPVEITNITLADAQAFGAAVTCPTTYWVVVYAKDGNNLKWTSNGKTGEQTSTPRSSSLSAWCELYNDDVFHFGADPMSDLTFYFSKGLATVGVTGVSLDKTTAQTIDVDGTVSFTATVSPDNATDKTVKWSVGGTDAGAVKLYTDEDCTTEVGADATDKLTVYAKGESAGCATVTATSNADSEKKASCDVTVNAAQTQTEELLTTITAVGASNASTATSANVSYSTEDIATLTFSQVTPDGYGRVSYVPTWGWWGYGITLTVTPADGYTITKCVFYDDANRTATDSEAPFVVETAEEGDKAPKVNGTPILAYTSKGIKKIEVYGYATPTATHSVTITPGDNMTKTAGSGDAEQTGLTGAMKDVVYTTDKGYYFPTNYSVAEVSGIKVTRDSYTQITVSGTPTADATITLTAPTAKTTPAAPTTAGAVDCTTSDNNDGKLTGVTTAMEYKKSDAESWTVGTGSDITGLVPGTYYVRLKATDTTNASANQELTIKGFISYTVTFKVVNGKWNEGEGDAATADKTVTLTGHDGDTLKLTADQIPAVGSKSNDTYKAGSWDTTPSADTEITADTTYTYTYAQKDSISQTVTFKVVNGSWNDETTTDKTVTLTGYEGDTLKLAADQIPAVGSKPNDTYKAGSWDTTPSADTAITAATTYTYTYAAKEASVVSKAPEPKTLTYTGSAQELVTAGVATGGELRYALGDANGATQPYTTSIPTATEVGTYYVWYKVKGDDNHNDSAVGCVTARILAPISATVTFKVVNGSWNEGEGEAATADKTVTLTGYEGDTLKLSADQIPAVGGKPNDTFKAGSWDVTPSTETAITEATTYTYTYAKKDSISATVTFKVVNGSWNEGEGEAATADKTVTLTGYEGDTLKLSADQIPAVGGKPNDTFKAGSWDVTPNTDTAITAATTYTYTYVQKTSISQTVTFKVVNGSWDDETTADKTVTLTGYEGDTLKLSANQIPAVGTKPADTYKAGSWDVTPSTDTAITEATTYTYTYAQKEAAVVTKAPKAKNLTYTGSAQELITAGEAEGGTMQYALGTATEATEHYTTSIPTATNAGTYYVWYKVVGDANHLDSEAKPVEAAIGSVDSNTAAPTELTLTYDGSGQPLVKPGSVDYGTLFYALGSNDTTAPTDGWSTEVPTATKAGTYYVWYKVVGDANHNDVDPACVVVTIGEAAAPATTTIVAPAASTSDYTLLASLKTSGKKALKMRWTAVPGAEGYDVFFGMCNKGDCQLLASVNGTSYKIKGLKKGFAYKAYVRAWKNVGGAKVYIGEPSPDVHAITNGKSNRYTNPKKISVKKKKLTVGVGKTKAIKAKLKKFSDSREYLNHVSAKVRYYSSDRAVATVSANGRVTGVGPGKCTVFAVAENGLRVGVKVTVK